MITAAQVDRWKRASISVAVVSSAACLIGLAFDHTQFFQAYLVAWLFWLGAGAGSLALLCIFHLTGGKWGRSLQNLLVPASRTLPLLGILFLPLIFGLRDLYIWSRPEAVARSEILQHKEIYLNIPFFLLRSALYLTLWSLLAWAVTPRSAPASDAGKQTLKRRSAFTLIGYSLTALLASVDWILSLSEEWFSTVIGMLFVAGHVLTALAVLIVLLLLFEGGGAATELAALKPLNDIGNLLLAFVMFWTYLAFMQYLIIFYGNIQHDIAWYVNRSHGMWPWIAFILLLIHFLLPFLILLFRAAKTRIRILAAVAALILVARWLDYFWQVAPQFPHAGWTDYWIFLFAPLALGGIWLLAFLIQFQNRILLQTRTS